MAACFAWCRNTVIRAFIFAGLLSIKVWQVALADLTSNWTRRSRSSNDQMQRVPSSLAVERYLSFMHWTVLILAAWVDMRRTLVFSGQLTYQRVPERVATMPIWQVASNWKDLMAPFRVSSFSMMRLSWRILKCEFNVVNACFQKGSKEAQGCRNIFD